MGSSIAVDKVDISAHILLSQIKKKPKMHLEVLLAQICDQNCDRSYVLAKVRSQKYFLTSRPSCYQEL